MSIIPSNFNLGYCCLNSTLRKQDIFASRTLRIATIKVKGLDYIKELVLKNMSDLMRILIWNKENNILFYRMSSEMFPFAAHIEYGYSLDFVDNILKELGRYAIENKMRLTYHPGQFNVLATESESILQNTFRDLNHHADVLNRMGLDKNSTMCIHGSGTYGDKPAALLRLEKNLLRLPENTRNRIALENCEMSYCIEDLLFISEKLQIPVIIDFLHDDIYNSTEDASFYFDRVFTVWNNRGIKPKVHVSNSVEGCGESKTARRKHSDYISFFQKALLKITFPIDVMLECKAKELAIFRLRDSILLKNNIQEANMDSIKNMQKVDTNSVKEKVDTNSVKEKVDTNSVKKTKTKLNLSQRLNKKISRLSKK